MPKSFKKHFRVSCSYLRAGDLIELSNGSRCIFIEVTEEGDDRFRAKLRRVADGKEFVHPFRHSMQVSILNEPEKQSAV
jgi:hypothetical protein